MRTCFFFFFNDTATTEIYTLSLHDALPISVEQNIVLRWVSEADLPELYRELVRVGLDRKSTRLNSSHSQIAYAVFCLKKKSSVRGRRWRGPRRGHGLRCGELPLLVG